MGHPRTHHAARDRGSKHQRKSLRHKTNQIQTLKQALGQQHQEYQKTMLWLLAVLRSTGGAVVLQPELLATQQRFGSLGWQAVPDTPGAPTLWTIRAIEAAPAAPVTDDTGDTLGPADESATPSTV